MNRLAQKRTDGTVFANVSPAGPLPATVRTQGIGDIGWAIQRQAELYAQEFRYSKVFEDYVVQSFALFVAKFDAKRDCLWIAELEGHRVGCIAIQHEADRAGWAKLRWYFVEKEARRHGLGKLLLETALAFARDVGYKGVLLWTVDDLVEARKQYARHGFRLANTAKESCEWAPWGHEQRWELPF